MKSVDNSQTAVSFNERLATSGLRTTAQRQHVYDVLLAKRDHPTAEEVFIRAKKGLPEISMATVYNCLEALVKCGLVRLVHLDRGPTRYCSNMQEHGHFHCDDCGRVYDFELEAKGRPAELQLPRGYKASHYEIAVHGICPECARSGERRTAHGERRGAGV